MTSEPAEHEKTSRAIRLLLEDWYRAGIDDLLLPARAANAIPQESRASAATAVAAPPAVPNARTAQAIPDSTMASNPPSPPMKKSSKPHGARPPADPEPSLLSGLGDGYEQEKLDPKGQADALRRLDEQVKTCRKCLELADARTHTVFGVGNPSAELCFLGEAPGADEDRQGEPFVGRAGQLLTRIIEACGLKRSDVYILNVLKCRPPGNRNPLPLEMDHCFPYLEAQLEIIQPKFICCLGAIAARALLGTTTSIAKMRGQFFRYKGSRVIVTYHPAYLLRSPSAKRPVWEDMKRLMQAMGRPIQEKKRS